MRKLKDEKVKLTFRENEIEAVFELKNIETFKVLSKKYTIEKIEFKLVDNKLMIAFLTTKGEKLTGFRSRKSTIKEAKDILKTLTSDNQYQNILVKFLEDTLKECESDDKCTLLNG